MGSSIIVSRFRYSEIPSAVSLSDRLTLFIKKTNQVSDSYGKEKQFRA